MNVSEFCIKHPVATLLMSAALVLAGLFAYGQLPVAALPRAEFPVVNVSAQLPGASPDTMATSVATPLIKQFATIAGIESISSTNAAGSTSIAIQFVLTRNIDAAAADVQAAIARAQRSLPAEMTTPPSYRKVNPADAPVLLLTMRSDVAKLSDLDAFAQQIVSPTLSTLDGVAQVQIFGSQKYAVRVQIDPALLAARGIGVDDLQAALTSANANTPVGALQNDAQLLTIQATTQLLDASHFADLIIATRNGRPVRLGEVARVIDSVENLQTASWFDGSRALVLAVFRQPDANTVGVVDQVLATLPTFKAQLPATVEIGSFNDRSSSIRNAVEDVKLTLGLTIALVVMVIFVFLRRLSATLIPTIAVPISLIATLAAMQLLGFSIDNISLLGLTLAVGLVVDDAIVMLENIVRHMEEHGLSAWEASLIGSREVGFTIVSISLSLVAVFIPVLLMGGVIGRVFNEFAVVVAVAILASAFVSLTLTPMLCAKLLKPHDPAKDREGFGGWLERGFGKLLGGYGSGLRWSLRRQPVILAVFVGTCAATIWMGMVIPKGFFPQEDIGQLSVQTEARQDISFDAMALLQDRVMKVFQASPHVAHVASTVGVSGFSASGMNTGRLFVELKPQGERPAMAKVLSDLRRQLGEVAGIATYMTPVQNLNIGARASRSQYQYVLTGIDQPDLYRWSERMMDALRQDSSHFIDVATDLQNKGLQATLVVDRDRAQALGVSADQLRSTLYSGFGARQVATIYAAADSYQVIVEFDPRVGWTSDRLDFVRVRSRTTGMLVPLSAFATVQRTVGPVTVNQLGQLPAVTLSFNLPQGVALGQAVERVEAIRAQLNVPPSIGATLAGTAKTFQQSLSNQGVLILGAVLTIYIVLGILYESFIHPFTILTGLPSAAVGALATLQLFGLDLSVIAIIGMLMLIGIVKKNAIMMIDVAIQLRRKGLPPQIAIYRACLMRFRPILMTTLAALLGALPIALGAGASAELRQPLGLVVVGGLVVSQVLTLFVTPVIYLTMERLAELAKRKSAVPAATSAAAQARAHQAAEGLASP